MVGALLGGLSIGLAAVGFDFTPQLLVICVPLPNQPFITQPLTGWQPGLTLDTK